MEHTDRPGREVPKDYRAIVDELIDNQGWRYDKSGKGHPMLYPGDRSQSAMPVPTTPGDERSLLNFRAQVRRKGGMV